MPKCKKCGTHMSEEDYSYTRIFYSIYMGLCEACREKVSGAIERAADELRRELRRSGGFSEAEIERRVYNYIEDRCQR